MGIMPTALLQSTEIKQSPEKQPVWLFEFQAEIVFLFLITEYISLGKKKNDWLITNYGYSHILISGRYCVKISEVSLLLQRKQLLMIVAKIKLELSNEN